MLKLADRDNFIKAQDVQCEKYGLNDREISRWEVEKCIVLKEEESAEFEIRSYR